MQLSACKTKWLSTLRSLFDEREAQNHFALILDQVLGLNRAQAILENDKEIEESKVQAVDQLLSELKKYKPIDYIFSQSIFFGREFYVDERVLIPRPETEELVQWVLENEQSRELDLLDIGSGSGCIPITLALEGNYKRIDACDISAEANQVARINANRLGAKVNLQKMDILSRVPKQKYDVIVSNPPYVKQEELLTLSKHVVEYEPIVALAPQGEPLLFYKRMIELAPSMLKAGGRFYWEIHEDSGEEVMDLLAAAGYSDSILKQDNYGRDRLIRAVYKPAKA